jgi:hypothetical protein
MIYHPQESKVSKFVKILAFWGSMLCMLWLCIMVFHDDVKIPQKEVTLLIDMKNRVNICLPGEEE